MHPTTQSTYQLVSIFGGNYVPEQHDEEAHGNLSPESERSLHFDELLKRLRAALSLR